MAYPKPPGYQYPKLITGASKYKPYNGYISGSMKYAPGAPTTFRKVFNFVAAPGDNTTITIGDGPINDPNTPLKVFTFDWGGSAGPGIIPLVAGGGTAAQAAVAAQAVLSGQLDNWDVTVLVDTISITSSQPGINPTLNAQAGANMNLVSSRSGAPTATLPGRIGLVGGFFPGV